MTTFKEIQTEISQYLQETESFYAEENPERKKQHKNKIMTSYEKIKDLSEKHLDDPNKISPMFFDMDTMELIKTISSICKNKPDFSSKKTAILFNLRTFTLMVESIIEKLSIETKSIEEITQESPELEKYYEYDTISVSSDRTVYPLDSIMHMRANLGEQKIMEGEKILFEVFNSKRKLLLSQYIDPTKNDHPDLAEANIFQACFKMEGKEWKVGSMYIVRGTYRSSYAEDTFVIDKRTPVIQSDKSVYIIGSDMILTVIDPDADKDNEVAEFVGDREDSKLIIESPYGKIEGYRLRETGDSTGIFQGIIGILGIKKDGSVIPQNADGKIIDKIQGTSIDDGYIGGMPGDELTVRYKNNTGTVHLTFFIANFGASVELDQKTYFPTDKIYITVVAPDFNFNSNVIDEIGQKPESVIKIRTSKDELVNYKLVETGTDSGIFTGEIQLTNDNDKSLKKSRNNLGPIDGLISCNNDDFIEVIFDIFENEKIIGRALIKNNDFKR